MKDKYIYLLLLVVLFISFYFLFDGKVVEMSEYYKVSGPVQTQTLKSLVYLERQDSAYTLDSLKKELEVFLQNQKGEWGIVVIDLTLNQKLYINENKRFHGASTTKVLTALSMFKKVEDGKDSLSRNVGGSKIEDLIKVMLNKSDNDSWYLLNNMLGFVYMQKVGANLGMENFDLVINEVTAKDMAVLLESIYSSESLSPYHRNLLFQYMQNTIVENRLPSGVPKGIPVIHKIGTYGTSIHDAGIVLSENPYILVAMSTGTTLETGTKSIQEISKIVYNFINK